MKLASFVHQGKERIGAAVGDTALLDLQSHWPADQAVPVSMVDLIERGEQGLQHAAGVLAQAEDVELIDIGEVDWLPPVVKPAKICGIAMNNSASNARKIAALTTRPSSSSPLPAWLATSSRLSCAPITAACIRNRNWPLSLAGQPGMWMPSTPSLTCSATRSSTI